MGVRADLADYSEMVREVGKNPFLSTSVCGTGNAKSPEVTGKVTEYIFHFLMFTMSKATSPRSCCTVFLPLDKGLNGVA